MSRLPGATSSESEVAAIAGDLLSRADELVDGMTEAIQAAIPSYRHGVVSDEVLRSTSRVHLGAILRGLGRSLPTTSPESRENGRRRAADGVPLSAILEAYRVGGRYIWERVADEARRKSNSDVVIRAGSEMWQVLDVYSQELADGYREEASAQALSAEQQRSALFQALFEGHLATTNPWEAAELLHLPANAPLVVVVADVPSVGLHAFSRAEQALRMAGVASAWRLLPDFEVGVVSLPDSHPQLEWLAAALESCATGRVGVSPPYTDIRETPHALTLARIALTSTKAQNGVTTFDDDLLGIAAVSAPEVMQRLAAHTFGGLDELDSKARASLLATFGAWLAHHGSVRAAADQLFVHRNTVHHRLRRLEQYTGCDLNDPRSVALLTLSYEVELRTQESTNGSK